jgi:S-adenosyl methyltransferase
MSRGSPDWFRSGALAAANGFWSAAGTPETRSLQEFMARSFGRFQFRTLAQVRGFFHDLEILGPGLVPVPEWLPDSPAGRDQAQISRMAWAGVARKPGTASPPCTPPQ